MVIDRCLFVNNRNKLPSSSIGILWSLIDKSSVSWAKKLPSSIWSYHTFLEVCRLYIIFSNKLPSSSRGVLWSLTDFSSIKNLPSSSSATLWSLIRLSSFPQLSKSLAIPKAH